MQPRACFATREKAGYTRHLRLCIDANATHEVVQRWAYFHRLFRDVDFREFLELVIHRRKFFLDHFCRHTRCDVEKHAAMRRSTACFDLCGDRSSDFVTREQLGRTTRALVACEPTVCFFDCIGCFRSEFWRDVVEHEPLAVLVLQDAAVATNAFSYKRSTHRRRPHHTRRMKLRELDVHQFCARVIRHRETIAGVLPRVTRHAPRLACTTRCEDDCGRAEQDKPARFPPITQGSGNPIAVFQETKRRALHVEMDALMNAMILQ